MTDLTVPDPGRVATIEQLAMPPPPGRMGSLFERLVTAGQTGGLLDAAIVTQPPGLATPDARAHPRGRGLVRAGRLADLPGRRAGWSPDRRATSSSCPRGLPHAFRITGRPAGPLPGAGPARLAAGHLRPGRQRQRRARGLPDGGLPPADIARWLELAPSYGIQVIGPPIPDPDAA